MLLLGVDVRAVIRRRTARWHPGRSEAGPFGALLLGGALLTVGYGALALDHPLLLARTCRDDRWSQPVQTEHQHAVWFHFRCR